MRKSYVRIEQNDHIDKADVENNLKSHLNLWRRHIDKADVENNLKSHLNLWRRHNNGNAHSDLTFHNF